MSAITPDQQNVLLDKILVERRSHRQFKPEFPPEEDIKGIIHAGLHAPFAAAAMGETENYFRESFVLKKGSKSLRAAASLIFEEVMATASNLERAMERDPELRTYARGFANRLAMIKKMGQVPGVGTAPYFIVVAERKGFPPI
ncbi:hypothetical protein MSSIT_1108 [Methanosarcina siciliae T4/M]|uniref:Nitroreductase domain-containing protein n=2 Tax=Methanosarcina siciliae TaxID=38027 RepID=A0A0E3P2T3_9EURY|nr:hypothetical protein MSSIT_1108 [Methanosarcina siciliae T4/M]